MIKKDYAFVTDIQIMHDFNNIMWIGTNPNNVSFIVETPIESIASSSLLNPPDSIVVDVTRVYPLNSVDFLSFNKSSSTIIQQNTPHDGNDTINVTNRIMFYSNISINVQEKSLAISHKTDDEGQNYTYTYELDFICGEASKNISYKYTFTESLYGNETQIKKPDWISFSSDDQYIHLNVSESIKTEIINLQANASYRDVEYSKVYRIHRKGCDVDN